MISTRNCSARLVSTWFLIVLCAVHFTSISIRPFSTTKNKKQSNPEAKSHEDSLWNVETGILLNFSESARVFYSYVHHVPMYAIERMDCTNFSDQKVQHRQSYFTADERIPHLFRANPKFYHHKSNVDRGHMMPAADFVNSKVDYKGSFRYSNIFPQDSKLNRHAWAQAEGLARNLIRFEGIQTLWVYTGIGFNKSKGELGSYEQNVSILGTDDGGMAYPDFVFKIFYGLSGDKSYIFSFLLPNSSPRRSETILRDHSVSVETIEKSAGLRLPEELKSPNNLDLCTHFDCKLGVDEDSNWQSDYTNDTDKKGKKVNLCRNREL